MQSLPEPLAPLANYHQFILWMAVERDGKTAKLPVDHRTAAVCNAHDPAVWLDAPTAIRTAALYGPAYGVGFVFTTADPFFFLDIDNCLYAGKWSPLAMSLLERLPGGAVEVSQSGKGLHIIARSHAFDHSMKNTPLGLELYTEGRFVALTGTNAIGSAALDLTANLDTVITDFFPPKPGTVIGAEEWTTEPVPEWTGPEDDTKLIQKATRAKTGAGVFGERSSFTALWKKDEKSLSKSYPDPGGLRPYDESSADAALVQHLAFWTGNNCERILGLMKHSALVREKWEREDYLTRTILRGVALQKMVYTAGIRPLGAATDPLGSVDSGPQIVAGRQYLAANIQLEHFAGCTYIQDLHRVFVPNGSLLKPEQFNATYGGYEFQLDDFDKTTRKAWDAFTESQVTRYPKAESMCFRPGLAAGALIQEEGRTLVNTYVPLDIPTKSGDAGPFLDHLTRVLPILSDRGILLAYMAACIQYKGVKFQWAPLLQGTEGNGKTFFTRCVSYALGKKYTHYPKASDIDNKFNGWLVGKLFIGIEDIYVPTHRREILETLKPMITGGDGLEIQMKGVDQVTADVCANFMLNSNHKDAIRKTLNDRRFSVFFTAQQSAGDLTRDGMSGGYFPQLYEWLRGGGFAIVADYLTNYAIPDALNPATQCHRAPQTSSTLEAIAAGLGGVEQDISEAIEEGRQGFAGGWVSSVAVERLLQASRSARSIPHNKRRELLQALGYDWHPALTGGRVNNPVPMDGFAKPRLFIRNGHIHANLRGPAEVVRAYEAAQTAAQNPVAEQTFGGANGVP